MHASMPRVPKNDGAPFDSRRNSINLLRIALRDRRVSCHWTRLMRADKSSASASRGRDSASAPASPGAPRPIRLANNKLF